jgi:hypothetical protein
MSHLPGPLGILTNVSSVYTFANMNVRIGGYVFSYGEGASITTRLEAVAHNYGAFGERQARIELLARDKRVDGIGGATGVVAVLGSRITEMAPPIDTQDAATKGYVDGITNAFVSRAVAVTNTGDSIISRFTFVGGLLQSFTQQAIP